MEFSEKLKAKFWGFVRRGDQDECWLWEGPVCDRRYGRVSGDGKQHLAHRLSVLLDGRGIPAGSVVMHRCDNGFCVNPAHLVVGTDKDNMLDKILKGRANWGTLTPDDVRNLRQMRRAGRTYRDIAEAMGMCVSKVFNAVNGKNFAWVE